MAAVLRVTVEHGTTPVAEFPIKELATGVDPRRGGRRRARWEPPQDGGSQSRE